MKNTLVESGNGIRQLFYLVFCLFTVTILNAQYKSPLEILVEKGDSLLLTSKYERALKIYKEALSITKNRGEKENIALIYKKLGFLADQTKNYNEAEGYYQKSIKQDSISLVAADCFHNIALIKRKIHQKDSVLYYLDKSVLIYEQDLAAPGEAAGNVFMNAGRIYKARQKYQTSLGYLLKAYQKFSQSGNYKKLAATCNAIASIHNELGNTNKAFQFYYESLGLRQKIQDTLGISRSYNNLANAFKKAKQIDSAIVYYRKSLALKRTDSKSTATSFHNLGVSYYMNEQKDSAATYYNQSLTIHKTFKDSLSMVNNYNELALISLDKNKLKTAYRYLDSIDKLIKNISSRTAIYRYYEIKSSYYLKINNYRKAYEFHKKYSDLYKSVFSKDQAEVVQNLQERFESKQRQNENLQLSLLNQEKQAIIDTQEAKLKLNKLLVFILSLLLLLLLVGYFLLRQRQITFKQKQKIEKMNAIFKGQEFIKRSIGKDLHDIITTNFDGLRLKILALPNAKDIGNLSNRIANEIKAVNSEIRLISHRLSPLDDKIKRYSLTTIINSQLSEFQMYRKVFVHLETEIPAVLNDLDLESQTNFYGILLEALNNIEKHSKATEVEVCFMVDNLNYFHMKIEDNGIGVKKENSEGVGVLNMKQRAELLNGKCIIKSSQKGTMLHLSFPIENK
ncbi:tetratricopeptide repeat protein [Ascidiimonas sp. W6]|uniref:tetratricopeptide repeat-containing sensor histidine kinase n=1 Tax=Ascidiimonas meishanensis TaxID=3128903 RepID=UPI0030EF1FCA